MRNTFLGGSILTQVLIMRRILNQLFNVNENLLEKTIPHRQQMVIGPYSLIQIIICHLDYTLKCTLQGGS